MTSRNDESARNARGALRFAMQIYHYDNPDFLRMYGGTIITIPDKRGSPFGILLRKFIALVDEADDCIEAFWERGARSEEESLAHPLMRTKLTDHDAQTIQAFSMAMRVYRPKKSSLSGHFDAASLAAIAQERHDLIERFADLLVGADRLLSYEPLPSTDERITKNRYAWILDRDPKSPETPEKVYEGPFEDNDEDPE